MGWKYQKMTRSISPISLFYYSQLLTTLLEARKHSIQLLLCMRSRIARSYEGLPLRNSRINHRICKNAILSE
jgi:hypothetical protein